MIKYIGLFIVFVILQTISFYIYKVAMKRLRNNRNIELTAVAMVEEEEKIDVEEQKAHREGMILIPEPEIALYYEL